MINSITLIEGTAEFSTEQERRLKNRLIKLLRKNGHNKFADRLENFSVKITALNDPKYKTAAISFDQGIIYINEGFLTDTRTFNQLDMLMRHELAHNLMMHQIRMTNYFEQKYGKEMGNSLINSVSVNDLLNIIMDDEISNTRYTAKDKELVRNLRWNNEIISGLVTEDHRINWQQLSLEQMYNKLSDEIDKINNNILNSLQLEYEFRRNRSDIITRSIIVDLYNYRRLIDYFDTWDEIFDDCTIEDFVAGTGSYHFACFDSDNAQCWARLSDLPKEWQDIVIKYYTALKNSITSTSTRAELKQLARGIATSHPINRVDLLDLDGVATGICVYAPEEKYLAIDILRGCQELVELYTLWYKRATNVVEQLFAPNSPFNTETIEKTKLDELIAELDKVIQGD